MAAGEAGEPDIDSVFAAIVAGYHLEAATPSQDQEPVTPLRPDPLTDPLAEPGGRADPTGTPGPAGPPPPRPDRAGDPPGRTIRGARDEEPPGGPRPFGDPRAADPDGPSLLDGLDTFGAELLEPSDTERYVPPPPPPLPRISKYGIGGLVAVALGFLLFLDPELIGVIDPPIVMVIGILLLIGGAILLVSRLRPDRDDDDPFDDGAVV